MTNIGPETSVINSKDISVVVQGAVDPILTPQCLTSIRKHLPQAEIILSTWEDEIVSGLSYDKVILSQAPASVIVQKSPHIISNNTNRMIYGVQQGLTLATRPYTLKIRTDIILQDADFLRYWDMYPKRQDKFQLFEHRVLNYYLFAPQFNHRLGHRIPTLFHPSDWMFFGLTQDVKRLFDIPLQPDPEYALWWANHPKPSQQIDPWPGVVFRFSPEQYLFYQALRQKFPEITFDNYFDITREKEQTSRLIMANNFVILDYRQWHIKMKKYQHRLGTIPRGQTSHVHWQQDYKYFCDPDFKISWKDILFKYTQLNIGEIIKAKNIDLEKRLILAVCPSLYKKHLQKKYAKSPERLKEKLQKCFLADKLYVYTEDAKNK